MLEPNGRLLANLLADPSPGSAGVDLGPALEAHARRRQAWYAGALGPPMVRDDQLAEVGRHWTQLRPGEPLRVSVVNTSGAGGLVALARRSVPGVEVVAATSALRDLDDLTQNVARVAAAAGELHDSIDVFVGLPYVPGWTRAATEVEAAGLLAGIVGSDPDRLADQLSVLIETDLPFQLDPGSAALLPVLAAVDALIDGAEPAEAANLLRRSGTTAGQDQDLADRVRGWDEPTYDRIRRRLVRLTAHPVTAPIDGLVEAALLAI